MQKIKFEFELDPEAALNIVLAIQKEINHMRFAFMDHPEWDKPGIEHMKRAADLMEQDLEIMFKGSRRIEC
jgi:hypothetical protein